MNRVFRDRAEAGQLLAERLSKFADRNDVLVLGLPRGGVPVAYEVARRLNAPLDVFVVRKLGLPGYDELAMGAIASGDVRVLNVEAIRQYGISSQEIEHAAAREQQELRRRELAYRGHAGSPSVSGRTVLLIDDGIATGSTMTAAIRAIAGQLPRRLVVAVPVAPEDSDIFRIEGVDEWVILVTPDNFHAVGQWYVDFGQTSDEEVTKLLAAAACREPTDFNMSNE
jgi:predicted phosphoribosyltransferase